MLKSIHQMFEAFEKSGIEYCHWKSNEHLAEALDGETDLDILFLPEQRAMLDCVLNQCGLKRFRAVQLMQYNAIEDYIGFDEATAKIWHLHLHYRLTLGEKHLKGYTVAPWGDYLLQNKVMSDLGVYTSCYEDELILLIIRIALKIRWRDFGRRIGKDDIKELEWLYKRIDNKKLEVSLSQYVNDVVADQVRVLIKQRPKTKNDFIKLQRILRKFLKPYTGYTKGGSWWVRSIRELFWGFNGVKRRLHLKMDKPCRRISPSGGSVIAFLGCDGAGKTTTIDYIAREFSKKLDVKIVYLGSGDGSCSLIRKPMKLVAAKIGGKGVGHAVEKEYEKSDEINKKVSIKARLYSVAKYFWAMTLAYEKKKKIKEITRARNNGMLVLVDRYPQVLMPGCSDGPLLTKYLKKGKGFLYKQAKKELEIYKSASLNPPDLVIKLTVPTEIAIIRKPEMTEKEIENKKAAVFAMNVSKNSVIIDTSVEKITAFSKGMYEIWKII